MFMRLTELFMGCTQSSSSLFDQTLAILFLGLDGSGSTTILYQFTQNKFLQTIPTLGHNHETFYHKDSVIECYDLGGIVNLRPLWKRYAPAAHGVVYSIDSTDIIRVQEACTELATLLDFGKAKNLPVLVYANKQDRPNALPVNVIQSLVAEALPKQPHVKVFGSVGKARKTLNPGMDWLVAKMKE